MRYKLLLFFSLVCFFSLKKVHQKNDCIITFENIGVEDFILKSDYNSVIKKYFSSVTKDDLIKGEGHLFIQKKSIVLNTERLINYDLVFEEGILVGYDFKINIGRKKEAFIFFEKIIKKIRSENLNKFINNENFAFMENNSRCEKFFRFTQFEYDNYIYGGIKLLNRNESDISPQR